MYCKKCGNEIENEDEEMDSVCDDCREDEHTEKILLDCGCEIEVSEGYENFRTVGINKLCSYHADNEKEERRE